MKDNKYIKGLILSLKVNIFVSHDLIIKYVKKTPNKVPIIELIIVIIINSLNKFLTIFISYIPKDFFAIYTSLLAGIKQFITQKVNIITSIRHKRIK